MYDPTVGRWLSKDPIAFEAGDANLYRYCGNDPANKVDPTGLQAPGYQGIGSMGGYIKRWEQERREAARKKKINAAPWPGEIAFIEAAKRNGVPADFIPVLIKTARELDPAASARGVVHSYCEEWVKAYFVAAGDALRERGYDRRIATNSTGIKYAKLVYFRVRRGATGNTEGWGRVLGQDHTVIEVVFKDGTVFYIDCGTISKPRIDINNLSGHGCHFSPAGAVPKDWIRFLGEHDRP